MTFLWLLACHAPVTTSDSDSIRDSDTHPPVDERDSSSPDETATTMDSVPVGETGDSGSLGDTETVVEPDCSDGKGWPAGGWLTDIGGDSAFVFVPEVLPECVALVFFGHGGTQAGGFVDGAWTDPLGTGLVELASTLGFVLVAPGVREGPTSEHVWGDEPEVLTHLDALVTAAHAGADLDRNKVFFVGQSAGGHMSAYLGLYVLSPWTGVAVVSAGLGVYFDYPPEEPSTKLPFYVAHDPDDTVVDYSYAEHLVAALEDNGHTYEFSEWDMGDNGHRWAAGLSGVAVSWLDAQY